MVGCSGLSVSVLQVVSQVVCYNAVTAAAGKLGVIIEKKRTRLINTSQVCKKDNKTLIKQS